MTKTDIHTKEITAFEAFFNKKLSLEDRKQFMAQVMNNCGISVPTFYVRLKNPSLYSPVEQNYIAALANIPVNELFN
jgi:hypothetical protein